MWFYEKWVKRSCISNSKTLDLDLDFRIERDTFWFINFVFGILLVATCRQALLHDEERAGTQGIPAGRARNYGFSKGGGVAASLIGGPNPDQDPEQIFAWYKILDQMDFKYRERGREFYMQYAYIIYIYICILYIYIIFLIN